MSQMSQMSKLNTSHHKSIWYDMAGKSIVFQLGFAKVLAQTDQAQDSNSAACTCVRQVGQEGLKTILAGWSLNRAHLQAAHVVTHF